MGSPIVWVGTIARFRQHCEQCMLPRRFEKLTCKHRIVNIQTNCKGTFPRPCHVHQLAYHNVEPSSCKVKSGTRSKQSASSQLASVAVPCPMSDIFRRWSRVSRFHLTNWRIVSRIQTTQILKFSSQVFPD